MKKISFLLTSLIMLGTISCSQEAPFGEDNSRGEGRILTSALSMDIKGETPITRSGAVPSADDFTIGFYSVDNEEIPVETYQYGNMPEVVTLPAGTYTVKAVYGGNYGSETATAAFNAPHYFGESETFEIQSGKILDNLKTIVCSLANVRVQVIFDNSLSSVMSADSKVAVRVGKVGNDELVYNSQTQNDGFFRYDENSNTLAATFKGAINGETVTVIKTFDNVKSGSYYKITFNLKQVEASDNTPGSIVGGENGGLTIDAEVDVEDFSDGVNVEPDNEEYLEDDMPSQGDDENNGDDNNGDDPTPDNPGNTGLTEIKSDNADVNNPIDITNWQGELKIKILTESTITGFICRINSTSIPEDELKDMGLDTTLDLVNDIYEKNPGETKSETWQKLEELGFPVGESVTNPSQTENGKKVVIFDLTEFAPILSTLDSVNQKDGKHEFTFEITNAAGQMIKTLTLISKQ